MTNATDIWDQISAKFAGDDKPQTTYWKRSLGDLNNVRVLDVFMKQNFEKTGQNPAIKFELPAGEGVFEITTTVLQKQFAANRVVPGDRISIKFAKEKTKGRYYNDKLVVHRDGGSEVPF